MQAMAEFVEQGGDFVVGQKRGFAAHGRGEVASQVGDRMLDAAGGFFAHDALIHPGPAALAGARVQVQVKTGPRPAVRPQDIKKQHLLMPGLDPRARLDPDAIELLGDGKQALDHLLHGKIRPERLPRNGEFFLAQLFGIVGDIPGLKSPKAGAVGREFAEFGEFAFRPGAAPGGQIVQKAHDLGRGLGHFCRQRIMGVAFKAQQAGLFGAVLQDFAHARAVVPLAGVRALIGGARHIGGVHCPPEIRVVGVLHDRQITGQVQREQPAALARLGGGLGRERERGIRQAGQFGLAGDRFLPGPGRVQQVFLKPGLQPGEFLLNNFVARLVLGAEIDPGQAEIAQGVIDDLLPGGAERGKRGAVRDLLVSLKQGLILPEQGGMVREFGQAGVIGRAQCLVVGDRMQMVGRPPGPVKPLIQVFQRLYKIIPVAPARIFEQGLDARAVLGQALINGRFNVGGADGGKAGQPRGIQQWIIHKRSRFG